ncbi:MAG: triple tyrosine motif-containing protein [Bacteroidota bacterium]
MPENNVSFLIRKGLNNGLAYLSFTFVSGRWNVKIIVLSLFVLLLETMSLHGQINSIGIPFIRNIERFQYQAGLQSWMISQSPNGLLYFANNDGLLEFDGMNWQTYPVPNHTIVHSVMAAHDGKVFAGCYNDFGYFEASASGKLQFHSMTYLLPANCRNFEDIWRIYQTTEGVVFQSYKQLFIFKDNIIKVVAAPTSFHFSYYVNERLLVDDKKMGLMQYANGNLIPLRGLEPLAGKEIWSVLSHGKDLLLGTSDEGLFTYNGTSLTAWVNLTSEFIKKKQEYCALRIDQNHIAFGSIQDGLLICDNNGLPLQHINRDNGLQNNTILCMTLDNFGNLWLGTDNGIDYIEINSPLSKLSYEYDLSAGYAAAYHDGILYLGTNQGVFYKNWGKLNASGMEKEKFSLIESTRGQVWKLQVIDDQLFCGHNNGTFIIKGDKAEKICDVPGCWTYVNFKDTPDKIIGGTYAGLILFQKKGGKWSYSGKISGFDESSRIMEDAGDHRIWMSHGFKGVFNIQLNNSLDSITHVSFFNSRKGFKTDYGINVTRLKGKIVFASPYGVYQYDDNQDSMVSSKYFNELFSNQGISYAKEDTKGNIWYFPGNKVAVKKKQEDGSYRDFNFVCKKLDGILIGGFQYFFPVNDDHVLLGYEKGFIQYDQKFTKNYKTPFHAYIRKASISPNDSTLILGPSSHDSIEKPVLSFINNSLHFYFSASDFENPAKVEFSSFLEGFEKKWTVWNVVYDREFTNLSEGDYTFYVKARNIYGFESESAAFHFTIKPHWSRTITAYVLYTIFSLCLLGVFVFWMLRRINYIKKREQEREKKKFIELERELHQEALESEREIIRLRNEKLLEEMVMKDKELANSTMHIIQINKLFLSLKKELLRISSESKALIQDNLIRQLIRKIDKDMNNEKNWEVFEIHFESVHEAFLKRLKLQFPNLTPREMKLCAYLRMNISNKEIATLMHISTRGVEISRYRLRKSLQLPHEQNLTDFILSF